MYVIVVDVLGTMKQSFPLALDWNATDYEGPLPIPADDARMILPMVLQVKGANIAALL